MVIPRVDVTWQQARASLYGRVGLSGDRQLSLAFTADSVDLSAMAALLSESLPPVSGTLAAGGTVSGTMARPVANIAVQGVDLIAYDESLGQLTADSGFANDEVTLSRLVLDKPQPERNGRISAMGAYNVEQQSYSFDVRSEDLQLLGVALPNGQRLRGDIELAGRGSGLLTSPAGTLSLASSSLKIDDVPGAGDPASGSSGPAQLGPVAINASAADNQATLDLSAERFDLAGHGLIGLTRPWPATLELRVEGLSLDRLPVSLSTSLDGELRASVVAAGNLAEVKRARSPQISSGFSGTWNNQPFAVTSPSRLRYADERLTIERLELVAGDSSLVVSGELPLTEPGDEGPIVEEEDDLATLAQYLPAGTDIAVDGILSLTGSISGTLKAADPNLDLSVENGLILSPELEPGLWNDELRARVADGEAEIEQIDGELGNSDACRLREHSARRPSGRFRWRSPAKTDPSRSRLPSKD